MAIEMLNLQEKIKKSFPYFAEIFITLASTIMVFLVSLLMYFHCYGNLDSIDL